MGKTRFFIIGAFRAGTTYLATVLDEHPDIYMVKPFRPEPKFFLVDDEFDRGIDYYESRYFSHNGDARLLGEKSVGYCESKKAAQRIRTCYPECKIIMMLRDPVFRAISNYYFSVNNGLEFRSLEEVFVKQIPALSYDPEISISPYAYLERGMYIDNLKMYERLFKRSAIRILIMENFLGKKNEIGSLYEWLGADPEFMPSSIHEVINSNDVDISKIDNSVMVVLRDYYRGNNRVLENHLGIDLSGLWL